MELRQFIKENMTSQKYDQLPELMKTSKTRITQMFNRPESMDREEIEKLCGIIGKKEITPIKLIADYNCGTCNLTLSEFRELESVVEAGFTFTK